MRAKRVDTNRLLDGIQLDRGDDTPLYSQLAGSLRSRIEQGNIPAGTKLPPTRTVATDLKINRATVVQAYHLLEREGWVESGVGSGTYAVDRRAQRRNRLATDGGTGFWSSRLDDLPRPEAPPPASSPTGELIRLTSPTADPQGFPLDEFRAALDGVFAQEGAACLDYGPHDGYAPLRQVIADRLRGQGVDVDPARVVLVNGSQQGLELIFRLLVPRGRVLLLEEPTYQLAIRTGRALRLPMRGIPLDEEGLRVDVLEKVLDEVDAGMLYMMPVFQNPTGLSLSADRRRRLLELSAERGLPIVEDHFDAELDYRGDAPGPLLAEGAPANIVLLGTFSKILFPGLRIGWLVVPDPLVGPLSEMKVCADLTGGLMTQMALTEFCRLGHLDRHLESIRERYRSRLETLLESLERYMPRGARWTRPSGGMTVWLRAPAGVDSGSVSSIALRRGVAVNPGSIFFVDGGGHDGFRICFVRETEERIRHGVRILAEVIQEELVRSPARDSESAAAPIL